MGKRTILEKRVETLLDKLRTIHNISPDKVLYDIEGYNGWFDTIYGNRKFYVNEYKVFEYIDFENNHTIFKINFNLAHDVKITPIMNLTAHEIDLAILEVENIVDKTHKDCIKKREHNERVEKYFNKQR